MREHQLITSVGNRFQRILMIIETKIFAHRNRRVDRQRGQHTHPVYLLFRHFRPCNLYQGRQNINIGIQTIAYTGRLDFPFPIEETRYACTAIECIRLCFPQSAGRTGMVAVISPRAVIRSENHQRIILNPFLTDSPQDFSHTPIQLHHHVSVQALLALSLKLIGNRQRYMRHRMRQIQEERFVICIPVNEIDRIIRVIGRQPRLVGIIADNIIPFN